MSYYLYEQPQITFTNSNPIINSTSNLINIVTSDSSNVSCYSLSVYDDAVLNGNVTIQDNCIVSGTVFCNTLSTQSYYTNKVIASSNLVTYDALVNNVLYHPRTVGSNVILQEILGADGFINFSNISGFPTNGQSLSSWFQSVSGFAQAGASLLNSGVSIGNQLESLFGSGTSAAAGIGENLAENLGNSLGDSSGDNPSSYNNSNSILVAWQNLKNKPIFANNSYVAFEQNMVFNNNNIIYYDQPAAFNVNTNNNVTYTTNSLTPILSIPDSALYLQNLSNVKMIDLSNIQIRNDGTIRRSIYNSNIIAIDSISFSNGTLSNIKWLNASNLQTQTVQAQNVSTSNILNTSSNAPLFIYSSNTINMLSSNQTYINGSSVCINYGITFDQSNNIIGISNVVSQQLSNNSFYTKSNNIYTNSNVYVNGDVNTQSIYVNNGQLLTNKKLISSQDFSNNSMWTSNGALYCKELFVNGITHTPIIDMLPSIPITSNYTPGLYTRSLLTINAVDSTINFQDSLNSSMLQSGTYAANKQIFDSRWCQNTNVNVFNY